MAKSGENLLSTAEQVANMVDIQNQAIERKMIDLLDGGVPKDRIEIKRYPSSEVRISVFGKEQYTYRWVFECGENPKARFEETTI